jgi:hypothetical protein
MKDYIASILLRYLRYRNGRLRFQKSNRRYSYSRRAHRCCRVVYIWLICRDYTIRRARSCVSIRECACTTCTLIEHLGSQSVILTPGLHRHADIRIAVKILRSAARKVLLIRLRYGGHAQLVYTGAIVG